MTRTGRSAAPAPRWLERLLPRRNFLSDRCGTTAVEFAMIAVPFLGLIGAIFETGSIYFRTAQLQMATETASRSVLTHSTAAGLTYKQFVDQNICTWKSQGVVKPGTLSTMFDCDRILVDVRRATTWSTTNTNNQIYANPNPGSSTIDMPAAGEIAIVRIVYPMTVISGFLGGGAISGQTYGQIRAGQINHNSKWTYMLMGIAAFRVEP